MSDDKGHLRASFGRAKSMGIINDRNKKESEKIFIILVLETIMILFKFKNLHFKLVQSEVIKSIVICVQKITALVEKERT